MSELNIQKSGTFTIVVGDAASNSIKKNDQWDNTLLVYGKKVTDGVITYTYQVSLDNSEWYDLLDDTATAIVPPLEGKAKVLDAGMFVFVRIKSSGNVTTANKVWYVSSMT